MTGSDVDRLREKAKLCRLQAAAALTPGAGDYLIELAEGYEADADRKAATVMRDPVESRIDDSTFDIRS